MVNTKRFMADWQLLQQEASKKGRCVARGWNWPVVPLRGGGCRRLVLLQ